MTAQEFLLRALNIISNAQHRIAEDTPDQYLSKALIDELEYVKLLLQGELTNES